MFLLRYFLLFYEKYDINNKLKELHEENIKVNLMYYELSCSGFWFTMGPILNSIGTGFSAVLAASSYDDDDYMNAMCYDVMRMYVGMVALLGFLVQLRLAQEHTSIMAITALHE